MATINKSKPTTHRTHEGAPAKRIDAELQLRRSVMACLLWENEFYESGETIAQRIAGLVEEVAPEVVAAIAIEARSVQHLRHVPLLLVDALAKSKDPKRRAVVGSTLAQVIQRPDELTEFLAIYSRDKRQPLAAQVKKGLAQAFRKFSAYSLAKYNRDGAWKLRDVLFLCHAKPKDDEQAATWKQLVAGTLPIPDTWEVSLSAGADKQATWTRLITEGKLGGLAMLRNLRNMQEAKVDATVIRQGLAACDVSKVLPFRFLAAAKYAPSFESELEGAMFRASAQLPQLPGKTLIVIDVSGSMRNRLSVKSEMTRLDAAGALTAILREVCAAPVVYATGGNDFTRLHATAQVPARHGIALRDAVMAQLEKLGGGGIFLTPLMEHLHGIEGTADRVVVVTDEQDCAVAPKDSPIHARAFGTHNYLINVGSAKNGIGYGKWTHIDGWSESVVRYIQAAESRVEA